jgi:TonB family protein
MTLPGHFSGDFCVDPVSARAVSLGSGEDRFQYADYVPVGKAEFPRSIRLTFDSVLQDDSEITVSDEKSFPDSLFVAPANSIATDFPSCSDAAKNSTGSRLDKKVQPEYPQNARMAHHQGTVWLYAIIAKDGSVQNLTPMGKVWPELERSAMDAVKDWKYTPYLRCGQAIEYETIISVHYSLSSF